MIHHFHALVVFPRKVVSKEDPVSFVRLSASHDNLWRIPESHGKIHQPHNTIAYAMDLGNHVLMLFWSLQQAVSRNQDDNDDNDSFSKIPIFSIVDTVMFWIKTAVSLLLPLLLLLLLLLLVRWRSNDSSRFTFPGMHQNNKAERVQHQHQPPPISLPQLSINPNRKNNSNHLLCNCPACNKETSFCFYPKLCRQWMMPLDDILVQVERLVVQKEEPINNNSNNNLLSLQLQLARKKARGVGEEDQNLPKDQIETTLTNTTTTDDENNNYNGNTNTNNSNTTGWRCACQGGFLPPGLLKSFGGAEAMMLLGTGQCYHKQY
jgi:hypothetical protein